MSKPAADRIPFAKILVGLAVAFGIGLGLCGLDFVLLLRASQTRTPGFGVAPVGVMSLVVLSLSAIGLFVTTIVWVVLAVVDRTNHKEP
jgi:hypothetical protein